MIRKFTLSIVSLLLSFSAFAIEIIRNPGFESDGVEWLKWKSDDNAERKISNDGRNGGKCAFLATANKGKAAWQQICPKLKKGEYHLSAWARSADLEGQIKLQISGKQEGKIVYFKEIENKGNKNWQQLALDFTVKDGVDQWIISLFLVGPGKVWFDDVELVQNIKTETSNVMDTISLEGQWLFAPGDDINRSKSDFDDTDWKKITVPELWENQGFPDLEGFAWYRKHLIFPDNATKQTRIITFGAISKADEVYFNGVKIGATGKFPPALESETFTIRNYLIPGKLINPGNENVIAVRVNDGNMKKNGGIWQAPCRLKIATPNEYLQASLISKYPGNIFPPKTLVSFKLSFNNLGSAEINNGKLTIAITDYNAGEISRTSHNITIPSSSTREIPLTIQLPEEGLYYVLVTLQSREINVEKSFNVGALPEDKPVAHMNNSRFGAAAHLNRLKKDSLAITLDLAARTGIKWIRTGFLWDDLEKTQGHFNWSRFDLTISAAKKENINILPILAITPDWASSDPLARAGNSQKSGRMPILKHWEHYVYEMVKRYSDQCRYWEIWNEPNLVSYWKPAPNSYEYFQLLQSAYQQVKKADANAEVLTAGLVPHLFLTDKTLSGDIFLDDLYKYAEGKPIFDHLGYHPYPLMRKGINNSSLENMMKEMFERIETVMKKHGDQKSRWWLTETGCPDLPRTIDERRQAECLVIIITACTAQSRVANVCWYNIQEDGTNPDYNEHNFGLVKNDFSPKPALFAYYTLIRKLGSAPFKESEKTANGVTIYKFKTARELWVAWSDSDTEYTVPAESKVCDLMGKPLQLKDCIIKIGTSPVYIELK